MSIDHKAAVAEVFAGACVALRAGKAIASIALVGAERNPVTGERDGKAGIAEIDEALRCGVDVAAEVVTKLCALAEAAWVLVLLPCTAVAMERRTVIAVLQLRSRAPVAFLYDETACEFLPSQDPAVLDVMASFACVLGHGTLN